MNRIPYIALVAAFAVSAAPQEPPAPKRQILFNAALYSTPADLWEDVREVDPAFNAIGAEVAKLAKGLAADDVETRGKALDAIKSLGLTACGAIKEERDRTPSGRARWELDSLLKELSGDWPGPSSLYPKGKPLAKAEEDGLRVEVAKLAKGLEADSIEDRGRAARALKSLGVAAYGVIMEERDRTTSDQARLEFDGILRELAGRSPLIPMGRTLAKAEGEALRKRLAGKKLQAAHHPYLRLLDGQPASVFIGDTIPAGVGRRRLRLDGNGRKLLLEEKAPAGMMKFGFHLLAKPRISEKDRDSLSLEIAITSTHIKKPLREIETPLGRVPDPEVIEIGVDLSPVLKSGQHFMAGPFPAADPGEPPWWLHVEIEVIGK